MIMIAFFLVIDTTLQMSQRATATICRILNRGACNYRDRSPQPRNPRVSAGSFDQRLNGRRSQSTEFLQRTVRCWQRRAIADDIRALVEPPGCQARAGKIGNAAGTMQMRPPVPRMHDRRVTSWLAHADRSRDSSKTRTQTWRIKVLRKQALGKLRSFVMPLLHLIWSSCATCQPTALLTIQPSPRGARSAAVAACRRVRKSYG